MRVTLTCPQCKKTIGAELVPFNGPPGGHLVFSARAHCTSTTHRIFCEFCQAPLTLIFRCDVRLNHGRKTKRVPKREDYPCPNLLG